MHQLNHGEIITQTDEVLIGGAWQRVPAEWVGKSVDFQTELEPGHRYVPVRRETSDAVELPKTIHQQPQAEICMGCGTVGHALTVARNRNFERICMNRNRLLSILSDLKNGLTTLEETASLVEQNSDSPASPVQQRQGEIPLASPCYWCTNCGSDECAECGPDEQWRHYRP